MENFPAYYTILYNAITDAVRLMDEERYGDAWSLLLDAQVRAENAYIKAGGDPMDPEEYEESMREVPGFYDEIDEE